MLHHLTSALALIFVMACCLYACRSKEFIPELPPDYFTLVADESVLTPAGITLIADTVNVSICPPNADCIVADNVSVSVRLIKGTESQRVRLFAPVDNFVRRNSTFNGDSVSVGLDRQMYKVILRRGQSINKSDNTRNSQAVIQVSRL